RLALVLRGTMAFPLGRAENAPSRVSRRRFAMRVPLSGPWHWKQFSERMGRTSRWKSTPSAVSAPPASEKAKNDKVKRNIGSFNVQETEGNGEPKHRTPG